MKQLQQVLAERDEESLRHIYQLWGLSEASKATSKMLKKQIPEVVKRATDVIAARFVWEKLTSEEQALLARVVGPQTRKGQKYDLLIQRLVWKDEKARPVVDALIQAALVYEEEGKTTVIGTKNPKTVREASLIVPLKESVAALFQVSEESRTTPAVCAAMTLDDVLEPFLQAPLQLILQRYDIEYYPYASRKQLRDLIHEALSDTAIVYEVVNKLDTRTRDLLKWLSERNGRASIQVVREHTGYDDDILYQVFHKLTDYALAFDMFTNQGRVLFIPQDTLALLKRVVAMKAIPVPQPGLQILATPPLAFREADALIQYDIAVLVGSMYQQPLEPTQSGYIPKRIAAKIQPLLHGLPRYSYHDENEYMEMVLEIARELKLLQLSHPVLQDIKQRYEAGAQLTEWTQLTLPEQTTRLLAQWTKSFRWHDLISDDYAQYDPYNWSPLGARSLLQKYLQRCIPGQWYSVASLLETIWDEEPQALRRPSYAHIYMSTYDMPGQVKQNKPHGTAARAKWMSSDAHVYLGSLASTLFELGIVALGYEGTSLPEDDFAIPTSFQLTELGAAVFASKTSSSTINTLDTRHSLVIQPNFELLLLAPDMATLYDLLPFAQIKQIERVSSLTLTRASILRGLANGKTVEQILDILRLHSHIELPQNVEYSIRDWTKQYKGIRLTQTILLEVSDEALVDELCTSKVFKGFGLRKLGPLAIAASGDINTLRRTLDKEGINVNITGLNSAKHDITFGTHR